jgi:hypothetical protein
MAVGHRGILFFPLMAAARCGPVGRLTLPGTGSARRDGELVMSSTTTPETNGTANGTTTETAAPRNRVKAALAGTKFTRLYALAGKAERKGFSLRRDTEEGTFGMRFDGWPSSLTPASVAKLAENGAKVQVKSNVGSAGGTGTGVVLGQTAVEMVSEMVSE